MDRDDVLLEVVNLKKYFPIRSGVLKRTTGHVKAVDDVSFSVYRGETLGLVGESGCGKSTLGRTILRLLNPTSGKILLEGEDIATKNTRQLRKYRKEIQIIFQDPYASLNPRMTIGDIVGEPVENFCPAPKEEIRRQAQEMLRLVGIDEYSYSRYAYEFSGGQRQRICIARALALGPKLVVCDEPVSALDVSVRSQVLNLMRELQRKLGLTYLFISHDLSVVKHISDRIAVMYLGEIVEMAGCDAIYRHPMHPYTKALLSAIPIPDPDSKRDRIVLTGDIPSPAHPPEGCRFHPRCPQACDRCKKEHPILQDIGGGHYVSCILNNSPVC